MISKNPKAHFVAALLDIDNFKFINDIYGHSYGDKALKNLANDMKAFFPSDTLLGRNGGDDSVFLCQIVPWRKPLNSWSNLPGFQRPSPVMMKNMPFIFLLDMLNIQHLQPTVHSLCAVPMLPFMKQSFTEKMDVCLTGKGLNQKSGNS